jgi:hypothetical protein
MIEDWAPSLRFDWYGYLVFVWLIGNNLPQMAAMTRPRWQW